MEKCMTIEDGVKAALSVYHFVPDVSWEYIPAKETDLTDWLLLDGEAYPLFWWRSDTQIRALLERAQSRKLCSMKLNRSGAKQDGLDRLTYKEMDIAELMLQSAIEKVMCFRKEHSLDMLATMENGCVAVFELGAVLHENTTEQGRHIYWGQAGMASDRVVSQKVASEAIYLFCEEEEKATVYNDIFVYMYGLDKTAATKAACIAEILMGWMNISDWKSKDQHYRRCIEAAKESARSVTRVNIECEEV